ncbi:MAG: hypothetical protein F4Z04_17885 [Acidobacteria bacterium]|nr:hypothetical protein [Acidobacteriota bacterium]
MNLTRATRGRFAAATGMALAIALSLGSVAAPRAGQQETGNELDRFMERVLEKREENAAARLQYILDETAEGQLSGPGGVSLWGRRGDYTWYERDGIFVRSPVRIDGVTIGEAARREYEADWLRQEERRSRRRLRERESPARWSRRTARENVRIAIEREWGGSVDFELLDTIARQARDWNDGQAAMIGAADWILEERGGVDSVGFGRAVAKVRDGFSMLEADRLMRDELRAMLDGALPQIAPAAGSATDEEFAQFLELFELAVRDGVRIAPVDAAVVDAVEAASADGVAGRQRAEKLREANRALLALPEVSDTGGPAAGSDRVMDGLEPGFVSDSFFLDFQFEPGRYYLVGRETLDGHEVVRIEYYPEQMFSDDDAGPSDAEDRDDDERAREIERDLDKTALVTLWIDPSEHQIVRYTFDNLGFEFLPGRWLFRVEELTASMTMQQPFAGVWLPSEVEMRAAFSLATGRYEAHNIRRYTNYREAESGGRIRSFGPPVR